MSGACKFAEFACGMDGRSEKEMMRDKRGQERVERWKFQREKSMGADKRAP
jgi:hypothetical protein